MKNSMNMEHYRFQRWATRQGLDLTVSPVADRYYHNVATNCAWKAWRAGREALKRTAARTGGAL